MRLSCFLLVLLAATPASALTGTELKRFCDEPKGGSGNISCSAYIRGLIDGLFLADHMAGSGVRYCPPENLELEQALLVVQKHLNEHPEQLNRNAGPLAALALYSAFPCKGSN